MLAAVVIARLELLVLQDDQVVYVQGRGRLLDSPLQGWKIQCGAPCLAVLGWWLDDFSHALGDGYQANCKVSIK